MPEILRVVLPIAVFRRGAKQVDAKELLAIPVFFKFSCGWGGEYVAWKHGVRGFKPRQLHHWPLPSLPIVQQLSKSSGKCSTKDEGFLDYYIVAGCQFLTHPVRLKRQMTRSIWIGWWHTYTATRPAFSQFWSFKIRRTTNLNYIKFADLLIERLKLVIGPVG